MTAERTESVAGALVMTLAATSVAAYALGWAGRELQPALVASAGALAAVAWAAAIARGNSTSLHRWPGPSALVPWALVVLFTLAALLASTWPALLPPGGASDLTHHLMLVDVLERTRHLVDGAGAEAALGEMAHYTPGLHLLIVAVAAVAGVDTLRVVYPLLAATVALKAGFVFLIAHRALETLVARGPLAVAAVGFVVLAPRAYSVDSFLQAGFFAQVAAELFVVAGWWAVGEWHVKPAPRWMALIGSMGAATFLVWPIWIGPLMVAVGIVVLVQPGLTAGVRARSLLMATLPLVLVAALHLSQHAAWLRMAGTSGAVPVFIVGPASVALIGFALVGIAAAWPRRAAHVTLWFAIGVVLQAVALYVVARVRGAETPYMAMKMIYLAVYPAAVLAALGLGTVLQRVTASSVAAARVTTMVILGVGLRAAMVAPVPPPIVSIELEEAGRWARANLPAECVDYVVRDAEQAYWLHLAVMGQPRSSARTADLDGYTANRAVGRWIEGTALPYAIASGELLPGEVLNEAEVVRAFGSAVIIRRRDAGC